MMIICHWDMLPLREQYDNSVSHDIGVLHCRLFSFASGRSFGQERGCAFFFIIRSLGYKHYYSKEFGTFRSVFCLMVSSIHPSIQDREKILNRIPVFIEGCAQELQFLCSPRCERTCPSHGWYRNLSLKNFSVSLTMDSMILPMNPTLLMLISFLISRAKNGVRKRRPSGFCRNILRMLPDGIPR